MACQAVRYWTLTRLIGAFLHLGIACFLLCCSAAAYFISKFLGFFGFSLPCPHDIDLCLAKLMVDSPRNKISAVQQSVAGKFPFDSVCNRNGDSRLSLKDKQLKGMIELEDEFENVMELDHMSFESSGVTKPNQVVEKKMVAVKVLSDDDRLKSKVRILKQALDDERAARAALFCDLEKERAASATAADEAMAMILRLQDEKAAIELEARQYERVLEEKSTYDADEMNVLKEIIVTRGKEKHSLEKEVESYRKMLRENDGSEGDADDLLGES